MQFFFLLNGLKMRVSLFFIIGLVTYGWLNLVWIALGDYLYFLMHTKESTLACKEIIEGSFCNSIVYSALWVAELPIIIVSFLTSSLIIRFISNKFSAIELNSRVIVFGYIVAYLLGLSYSGYGFSSFGFIMGTLLIHGSLYFLCLRTSKHLTSYVNGRRTS